MAEVADITIEVRSATTGEILLGPLNVGPDTTVGDVAERTGLTAEGALFKQTVMLHASSPDPIDHSRPLAELADGKDSLEFTVIYVPRQAELKLTEVALLERSHPEVSDVVVDCGDCGADLGCLSEKFPQLQRLQVKVGSGQYDKCTSYWDPLRLLTGLQRLHIANHHGGRNGGQMKNQIFDALLSWGDEGPKLTGFLFTGAMTINLEKFAQFITSNSVLSPDLQEFAVQYWFANPPLVNTQLVQMITNRYQKLRVLELGSCCHSVTDDAFKYFADNEEGVQAGLNLERLFLVCITQVEGQKWLDPESVKRCLPKLKDFSVGGGRCFCRCGERGCGAQSEVVSRLETECGVTFTQSAAHW